MHPEQSGYGVIMAHWAAIRDGIGMVLQALTIIVLLITWWAIRRQARAADQQARAADELAKATCQQIQMAEEQARTIREQVEVAKRQITESLRPILTLPTMPRPMPSTQTMASSDVIKVQNTGVGTAFYVWWSYGEVGTPANVIQRRRVGNGILPPMRESTFEVMDSRASTEGIVIVCTALDGSDSATTLKWNGNAWVPDYVPNVNDWSHTLLGVLIGGSR